LARRPARAAAGADLAPVYAEVNKRAAEATARLQDWIRHPTIAAERRGVEEGVTYMMRLAREAGFPKVEGVPTDGVPGVFATWDVGAPRTLALYFMYDVKQVEEKEWSSPPWKAALLDLPGVGKVVMGRGAVNQKGPESAVLAALHALRGAGRKPPVNLVLVAEGEEEIGSVHFAQVLKRSDVQAALKRCQGVVMPSAAEGLDGTVTVTLGAKGVLELELESNGARWGRGPKDRPIHSSNKARVDSPVWRLVHALATLVAPDGNDPAIDGLESRLRPLSSADKEMIAIAARRIDEATVKKQLSVERWARDADFRTSLERLVGRPTVNIEGLVAGYTGPGGMTILPHKAVAKLDIRLVPDMRADEALAAVRAHLDKRGFKDIEVRRLGGYSPTSTARESLPVRAELDVYRRAGKDAIVLPRGAGSWPGYLFTDPPLSLPAIHFGLGHGNGAHSKDEYFTIESRNPKIHGLTDAIRSHVDFLHTFASMT
jgi:acetylornithine deacetylase/succinyl-diaminopimelate desuccinylase-like protein